LRIVEREAGTVNGAEAIEGAETIEDVEAMDDAEAIKGAMFFSASSAPSCCHLC